MGAHEEKGAGGRLILKLDDEPNAVARVRAAVTAALEAAALEELVDDAQLVASELVTNALLHGGSPVRLLVRTRPPVARLEVHDPNPVPPARSLENPEGLAGRGLHLIEALGQQWGVNPDANGKSVWVVLEAGGEAEVATLDEDELLAMWTPDEDAAALVALPEPVPEKAPHYRVSLGEVPTELLLAAKEHVDDLVREFTLATTGARVDRTSQVPSDLGDLLETVVHRFAEPRQAIKRQALEAARAGQSHVWLNLDLPAEAADAAEQYLEALDEVDAYCRAARMLTLESPPQHRVFRRWYIEGLVAQLRDAAAGQTPAPTTTFEQRLLDELDRLSAAERNYDRTVRLQAVTAALASALTPEAVAAVVLDEGVAALGATAGGLVLAGDRASLQVPGTLGYDDGVVARLREEPLDADLPAAVALRTGEAVWLESRSERDKRFPGLLGLEPGTVSMCAVPLEIQGRCIGALRFSFTEARLFDAEEREFVLTLAQQAAQALDRSRLHQQHVEAVQRLQRNLMPDTPPQLPGFAVFASHEPATAEVEVGSDFYDLWPCGEDTWVVAIGDVAGTGPRAAAFAMIARVTLRAATLDNTDPLSAITRVDQALRGEATDGDLPTCPLSFGVITTRGANTELRLAGGGHTSPVLLRADGTAETIALAGTPPGGDEPPVLDQATATLAPGDDLVLFTDGVTHSRGGMRFLDVDELVDAAVRARAADESPAEAIAAATRDRVPRHGRDDRTVVTLRREGGEAAGHLPARPPDGD